MSHKTEESKDTVFCSSCRDTQICRHCNGKGIVMYDNFRIYLTKSKDCECDEYYEDCICPMKCECNGSGVCEDCEDRIDFVTKTVSPRPVSTSLIQGLLKSFNKILNHLHRFLIVDIINQLCKFKIYTFAQLKR